MRVCRGSGVGGDVAHAQHLVDTIVIIERSDGCRALAVSGVGILGGGGLGVFVRVVSGGVGIRVIRVVSVKIVGSVSIAVGGLVRICLIGIEGLVGICVIGISFCVIGIIIEISFCVIGIIIDIVIV